MALVRHSSACARAASLALPIEKRGAAVEGGALSGIFAGRVHGAGHQAWPSVLSFGTRPTVDGSEPLLEAHLFDYRGDLYGRRIAVEFVCRLRDEEKFDGLPALVAQMHRDASAARAALKHAHATDKTTSTQATA